MENNTNIIWKVYRSVYNIDYNIPNTPRAQKLINDMINPFNINYAQIKKEEMIKYVKAEMPTIEDFEKVYPELKEESSLVKHAKRELELIGYDINNTNENDISHWFVKNIIELITLFSEQGHSGFSVHYLINTLNKLMRYDVLSPLTFKDDEWNLIANDDDSKYTQYQNKRKSNIFKKCNDNVCKIYDIDAWVKVPRKKKRFDSKNIELNKELIPWHGTLLESRDGIATGRGFRRVYIKDKDYTNGYLPKETIKVYCTEIEVQKDDWLMFVEHNEKTLVTLSRNYDIEWFEIPEFKGQRIIDVTNSNYNITDE